MLIFSNKFEISFQLLSINKLNDPTSACLESNIITQLASDFLNFFIRNLSSFFKLTFQKDWNCLFSLWTESFSASSFFSLYSLLRPSLNIFARDLKFTADFNNWTVVFKKHSNSFCLLLNCVIFIRTPLVLFFIWLILFIIFRKRRIRLKKVLLEITRLMMFQLLF